MNYFTKLWLVITTVFGQKVSFRLGNYTLSASNNGDPVAFTVISAWKAIGEFESGNVTSFQVGSTLITVTPTPVG